MKSAKEILEAEIEVMNNYMRDYQNELNDIQVRQMILAEKLTTTRNAREALLRALRAHG